MPRNFRYPSHMAAEPGLGETEHPFGNVGGANDNYLKLRDVVSTLKIIEEKAAEDLDQWSSELAKTMRAAIHAIGGMFKEETMRTAVQIAAAGGGRAIGVTGAKWSTKGIMEYKVITNMKPMNGDETWFRQWHMKFTTALGQVKREYQWLVNNMTNEIDLSKGLRVTSENLELSHPELYKSASEDI